MCTTENPPYLIHYDAIVRYGNALLGNNNDANELAQEVISRYINSGANLEGKHLRNWLFLTARNLVRDKYRARKKMPQKAINFLTLSTQREVESDPAIIIEKQETIKKAISFLEVCSKQTRVIFRYKFYDGLCSREIGEILGISSSSVRKILLGKIAELRDALTPHDR